jgi:lysophospholipase L1-like esterase
MIANATQAQYLHESWAGLNMFAQENRQLRIDKMPINAVFIGNSITQMWAFMRPDFFRDNTYSGRGIGGQTTSQMLSRFRADVVELHPRVVVINGGINDISLNTGSYDFEFTFGNIKSMVEIALANHIRVVLTSVLPAAKIPWREEVAAVPAKIDQLNAAIKEYGEAHNLVYVDYYSHLVSSDGSKGMKAAYTSDGVHVTPAGYEIMENIIKKVIDTFLE